MDGHTYISLLELFLNLLTELVVMESEPVLSTKMAILEYQTDKFDNIESVSVHIWQTFEPLAKSTSPYKTWQYVSLNMQYFGRKDFASSGHESYSTMHPADQSSGSMQQNMEACSLHGLVREYTR